ncbi:Hypothetical protein A7982_09611 [Minicystis rosea]|nr:Hypothetical protein A7982_09611 [Minicystis rosea]
MDRTRDRRALTSQNHHAQGGRTDAAVIEPHEGSKAVRRASASPPASGPAMNGWN